jgi:hypothetical protein
LEYFHHAGKHITDKGKKERRGHKWSTDDLLYGYPKWLSRFPRKYQAFAEEENELYISLA